MKKTLIATVIAAAFGVNVAWANGPTMQTPDATAYAAQAGIGNNQATGGSTVNDFNAYTTQSQTETHTTNTLVKTDVDIDVDVKTNNSDQNNDKSTGNNRNNKGDANAAGWATAANNSSTAISSFKDSFNSSKTIAKVELNGFVSHNSVKDIGNIASNKGDANGASGGKGGSGYGGKATGGDGGSARGGSASTGKAEAQAGSVAASVAIGANGGSGSAAKGPNDTRGMSSPVGAASGDGGKNIADAESGKASADASSGNARGGSATGGNGAYANAGDGQGGAGGAGGDGGSIKVDAGSFNMSNNMLAVGQSAAGIMVATQNSGMNSLVQNAVNVQATLNVGSAR